MSEEFPDVPQNADELGARWATRDAEYAKQRKPMEPEMAEAVRMTRMQEANRLPNIKERGYMYGVAKSWTPPLHPDFGGLRDWL